MSEVKARVSGVQKGLTGLEGLLLGRPGNLWQGRSEGVKGLQALLLWR